MILRLLVDVCVATAVVVALTVLLPLLTLSGGVLTSYLRGRRPSHREDAARQDNSSPSELLLFLAK